MRGLRERRPTTLIAILLATFVAGVLATVPTAPRAADAALSGKLVPTDAAFFGAWIKPRNGWSQAAVKGAIRSREAQLGRKLDISQVYYPWGTVFPTWRERWDIDSGRIPLITWAEVNTDTINQGKHDAYIRARADGVRNLGAPIFIRWFSEMEAGFQKSTSVSPSAYIAAWRRIVKIFKNRGATNVVWVWCGTAAGFASGEAQKYYPGPAYVDWACADGFNWAPRNPGSPWTSFEDIFKSFYAWGSNSGKPLMIAETGTEEGTPGRKAQWVLDARDVLKASFPNIKAFVYFDTRAKNAQGIYYNWWMDTSATSLEAFRLMASDPYFRWNRFYRPDAQIRGKGSGFAGDGVYGDRQAAERRQRRKGRTQFEVLVENDGNIGDVYRVHQQRVGKRLTVRYLQGSHNITSDVRSGSYLTPELEPGESVSITIRIRPKRGKSGKAVEIRVSSGGEPKTHDTVIGRLRKAKRR